MSFSRLRLYIQPVFIAEMQLDPLIDVIDADAAFLAAYRVSGIGQKLPCRIGFHSLAVVAHTQSDRVSLLTHFDFDRARPVLERMKKIFSTKGCRVIRGMRTWSKGISSVSMR